MTEEELARKGFKRRPNGGIVLATRLGRRNISFIVFCPITSDLGVRAEQPHRCFGRHRMRENPTRKGND